MPELHFRIPDRAFVWLSLAVIVLTWGIVIWAYPFLPEQIPTHFGPSGLPDDYSKKSFWSVAFLPIMQIGLAGVLWRLYQHPRFSNYPGVKNISLMPEPYRRMLERLGQHLIVVVAVVVNLLLAQITLSIVSVALRVDERLNVLMVVGLVIVLLGTVGLNMVRMHRIARLGQSVLHSTIVDPKKLE